MWVGGWEERCVWVVIVCVCECVHTYIMGNRSGGGGEQRAMW